MVILPNKTDRDRDLKEGLIFVRGKILARIERESRTRKAALRCGYLFIVEIRSCSLLETPADDTAEHVNTDTLALDLAAGLVLLVGGHLDHGVGAGLVNLPAADLGDELLESLAAAQVEPLLQNLGRDLTEGLADLNGNADAHELLEAGNVGNKVGVQVIRVQGGPELGVLSRLEEGGETGELLDRLDEVGGLGGGLGLSVGGLEGLSVGGEESKAEGESRRGEDSQGLDEDVGDGLRLEKVGVELVPARGREGVSISDQV